MSSGRAAPDPVWPSMASSFDRSQVDWFRAAEPVHWHRPVNGWRRTFVPIRRYLNYRDHCPKPALSNRRERLCYHRCQRYRDATIDTPLFPTPMR